MKIPSTQVGPEAPDQPQGGPQEAMRIPMSSAGSSGIRVGPQHSAQSLPPCCPPGAQQPSPFPLQDVPPDVHSCGAQLLHLRPQLPEGTRGETAPQGPPSKGGCAEGFSTGWVGEAARGVTGIAGYCWAPLGVMDHCRASLGIAVGFSGHRWALLGVIGHRWALLSFVGHRWAPPAIVGITGYLWASLSPPGCPRAVPHPPAEPRPVVLRRLRSEPGDGGALPAHHRLRAVHPTQPQQPLQGAPTPSPGTSPGCDSLLHERDTRVCPPRSPPCSSPRCWTRWRSAMGSTATPTTTRRTPPMSPRPSTASCSAPACWYGDTVGSAWGQCGVSVGTVWGRCGDGGPLGSAGPGMLVATETAPPGDSIATIATP